MLALKDVAAFVCSVGASPTSTIKKLLSFHNILSQLALAGFLCHSAFFPLEMMYLFNLFHPL